MGYIYRNCEEGDAWVQSLREEIDPVLNGGALPEPLKTIAINGRDGRDAIPVRFNQYSRSIYIFRRRGLPLETYRECARLFAVFPDAYYHTHQHYYDTLQDMSGLQTSSRSSPVQIAFLSDLLDSFYAAAMSGKFADRRSSVDVDREALAPLGREIKRAFGAFYDNPFFSLGAACHHAALDRFYESGFNPAPPGQSAEVVLGRVSDLVFESAVAVSPDATFRNIRAFFNLASVYMRESDEGLDIEASSSRRIRR